METFIVNDIPTFVSEDHTLDWHTCQICYPLDIKLLLFQSNRYRRFNQYYNGPEYGNLICLFVQMHCLLGQHNVFYLVLIKYVFFLCDKA